ncbi:restriction endonuclease subunit S [Pseudomonas sp. A214]|jgi:type I restriction enzyme, S subunit|uniref:restriction endonuclease subunit S n=1 Tax=Pseudomonas sp. A214 TaxID=1855331 RepID=UPI000953946E|nr:restriction endonuclease subunit S [Pseudomonas sp. A214]SIR58038.1 type I restriction enzyme, S subunit [Pseudomonas sp. A214]
MELKSGYKKTEVGIIPESWSVKELGDFAPFITSGSRGWANYYSEFGAIFLRITNLSRGWLYPQLDDLRFVSLPKDDSEGARTQLKDGDLLISITADIGVVGYVDAKVPKPAYINQHIALVRLDPSAVNSLYTSYFLASANGQALFRALTDSGAKAGMNLSTVRKILAVFPPSLDEQMAIAEALSNVDALIESLRQLLNKKRQIKQGTMQGLLTGQRRLPGFSEEWKVRRLGAICHMKSGVGITRANINEYSLFPCFGGNGLRGFTNSFTHEGTYALIGRQGALCGNVQIAEGRFFASEHAIVVSAEKEVDINWISRVLIRMNLNQYAESSAQPGLSVSKILKLECEVPPYAEQIAIACALSAMDNELATLESKLQKARNLKQGMMQELLTGRIRLV